jgi:hypothetical protein
LYPSLLITKSQVYLKPLVMLKLVLSPLLLSLIRSLKILQLSKLKRLLLTKRTKILTTRRSQLLVRLVFLSLLKDKCLQPLE